MPSKIFYSVMVGLGLWWAAHIFEGNSALERANKTCDPFYWAGKFSNKEIVSGFTNNESESYKYSQGVASDIGQACFFLTSRVFHAVNPAWSYEQTQWFNTNEKRYKKQV